MTESIEVDDEIARNQDAISETAEFELQRRLTFGRIGLQPDEWLSHLEVE